MLHTMLQFLEGGRPDITAAQIVAVGVAGVPATAALLSAFGVGDADARKEALTGAMAWSTVFAALLVAGERSPLTPEAGLRDFEADDGPPVPDDTRPRAERRGINTARTT